jgi:hypothetical protein
MFNVWQKNAFTAIRDAIDNRLANLSNNSQVAMFSDLEKLSELKDKGIITEDDFNAKKKQILGLSQS